MNGARIADAESPATRHLPPVARKGIDYAVEPFGQELLFSVAQHIELGRDRTEGDSCGHRPVFRTFGRVSEDLPKSSLVHARGEARIALLRRVLESRVHRVAVTGRLGVSEQRAVNIIQAAGIGAIQTLLSTPAGFTLFGVFIAFYLR
jgi:hypothetical protein